MKGVRKDERATDQRYRQDERIRRYPAGTAGAQQACVRPAESSCGGFLHRGQAQTRADFQEKARYRRWGAGGQADRSQRSKKAGNSGSGEHRNRSGKGVSFLALLLVLILGAGAGLGGGYYLWGWERPYTVDLKAVEVPDYVEQDFIRKNIFSRPDVGRQKVDKIVIHYVANPGSTAKNNRDYFDSLADQDPQKSGSSASSHFVVGLEGEVIQCIPVNEIAYANAPLNNTTVAIEVCHPDDSGKFNDATYESLVDLTAFLCRQLKLTPGDVIRHYDVNEKLCPKYYVEHEDAWEQFLKDVKTAMKTESAG